MGKQNQTRTISLKELLDQGRIKSESGEIPEGLVKVLLNEAGEVKITPSNTTLTIRGVSIYPDKSISIYYQRDCFERRVNGGGALILKKDFRDMYVLYAHPKQEAFQF